MGSENYTLKWFMYLTDIFLLGVWETAIFVSDECEKY